MRGEYRRRKEAEEMSANAWLTATIIVGGISTLAVYSFLIKENPFYRFFEHLFIGIAAGFLPVLTIKSLLWPRVFEPMLGLDIVQYPDGTFSGEYHSSILLYFFPMTFGLLYYCIYSKRFGWLAKLAIGFALGAQGGLAFKGFFAEMLPQLGSSFKPLLVIDPSGNALLWQSLENCFFVFTLLAVMYYFFFSFQRDGKTGEVVAMSGRWLMMVCFGAFFGSTVMARLALLVERVQFLLIDWWQALSNILA